jgi:hypothetical protein
MIVGLIATTLAFAQWRARAAEPVTNILYDFKGVPDGARPSGRIVLDQEGVLGVRGAIYGVTEFGGRLCDGGANTCGAIFQLRPPKRAGSRWAQEILHRFDGGRDGKNPTFGLILDSQRKALFGVTPAGGVDHPRCFRGCGTVFSLAPDLERQRWAFRTIYRFKDASDGAQPEEIALRGKELFGVVRFGGFNGNDGGSAGGVFRLRKPPDGKEWVKSDVYQFGIYRSELNPAGRNPASLSFDPKGRIIVPTPNGGLSKEFDGVELDMGTLYRLSPPADGSEEWKAELLYRFTGEKDGGRPVNVFINTEGGLFGATSIGGAKGGGTFYSFVPPEAGDGPPNSPADPLVSPTILDSFKSALEAQTANAQKAVFAEEEKQRLIDAEEERLSSMLDFEDPISRLRAVILFFAVYDNALAARELKDKKRTLKTPGVANPPVIVRPSPKSPLRQIYGTTRDRGPGDVGRVYVVDVP